MTTMLRNSWGWVTRRSYTMVNRRNGKTSKSPAAAGPPVTYRSRIKNSLATSQLILEGQDQLAFVADVSKLNDGDIVVAEEITAASFPRLAATSRTFQRIKYHKLKFDVQSQMPTSTSGGFISAFITDPNDLVSGTPDGKERLMANKGSMATKAYDSFSVIGKPSQSPLFTNQVGEPRLYSPGQFVMVVNGKLSQEGSVMVTCKWKVTLSQPTVESPVVEKQGLVLTSPMAGSKTASQGFYPMNSAGVLLDPDPDHKYHHMLTPTLEKLFAGQLDRLPAGWHYYRIPYGGQIIKSESAELYHFIILVILVTPSATDPELRLRAWTREAFQADEDAGIFSETERAFLLRGDTFLPLDVEDFATATGRLPLLREKSSLSRSRLLTYSKTYQQLPQTC